MRESAEDLRRLQELLDRSYAEAGPHLSRIHTEERRLDADALSAKLEGMKLLVLATTSAAGRPVSGPVDGIFLHGAFHFGSSPDSVRARHIAARPEVSATHLPSEELAVTVHGRAETVDVGSADSELRQVLLDIYLPRFGEEWLQVLEGGVYWRIEPRKMFSFWMPEG